MSLASEAQTNLEICKTLGKDEVLLSTFARGDDDNGEDGFDDDDHDVAHCCAIFLLSGW